VALSSVIKIFKLSIITLCCNTVGDLTRSGNQGIPHFTFPEKKEKKVKIFPVREIK